MFYGVVLKVVFWSDIQSLLKSENDLDIFNDKFLIFYSKVIVSCKNY